MNAKLLISLRYWPWPRILPLALPLAVFLFYHGILGFYFFLDDWQLVGPPAAARFLANPISTLNSFQFSGHYSPVSLLYYSLTSLLFGANPFPYHLASLVLMSLACILLHRLLGRLGFSALPAFFASVYFAIAVSQYQVLLWITASNYLLLSIFLLLAFSFWEDHLARGRGRDLGLVALSVVLAQFTHSIGFAIPFVLLLRGLIAEKEKRVFSLGTRAFKGVILVGLALLCQLAPRLLLADVPGGVRADLTVGKVLSAVWFSLTRGVLGGVIGQPGDPYYIVLAVLLGGGGAGLLLAWLWGRRGWRIAVPGIALALGAWVLPFLFLPFSPEQFATRFRYMLVPNLGLAILLAALLENFRDLTGRSRRLFAIACAVSLSLFLIQSWWLAQNYLEGFKTQDAFIRQVAERYQRRLPKTLAGVPCPKVTLVDAKLLTRPIPELAGTILIQDLDHETLHRFLFKGNKQVEGRVEFISYNYGMEISSDPCTFFVLEGQFIPGVEARNMRFR